ncbi:hypothetical protein [Streptomyces phaeochromogenes]
MNTSAAPMPVTPVSAAPMPVPPVSVRSDPLEGAMSPLEVP